MGWIVEFFVGTVWQASADGMSRGKPWWVWVGWMVVPVAVVGALIALVVWIVI